MKTFMGINLLMTRNGNSLELIEKEKKVELLQIDIKGMEQLKKLIDERRNDFGSGTRQGGVVVSAQENTVRTPGPHRSTRSEVS